MYPERVHKFIDENSDLSGSSNAITNPVAALQVGILKLMWKWMFCWYYIPKAIFSKKSPSEKYYHPYIHSKHQKLLNLDSKSVIKNIEKTLKEEVTELKNNEEIQFAFSLKDNCMIFTDNRLIYSLESPKKMSVSQVSGQIPLSKIGRPKTSKSITTSLTVQFGENTIGTISESNFDEKIQEFFVEIYKSLEPLREQSS